LQAKICWGGKLKIPIPDEVGHLGPSQKELEKNSQEVRRGVSKKRTFAMQTKVDAVGLKKEETSEVKLGRTWGQ